MKKIFLAAMAAIALITASCNKTDDDVKIEQITVSNPVINPECMDMYLYEDLEPNIISWSEPEVSDGSKVKFEYQFMGEEFEAEA